MANADPNFWTPAPLCTELSQVRVSWSGPPSGQQAVPKVASHTAHTDLGSSFKGSRGSRHGERPAYPSQALQDFQMIFTSLRTSCFHVSIKLTADASVQSHALFSANYSLSSGAGHSSSSAGSKRPICQAGQLQLNMAGDEGHTATPIWGQRGKEHAAGSPRARTRAPDFASHMASSTGCVGALSSIVNQAQRSPLSPAAWNRLLPLQAEAQLHAAAGKQEAV